MKVHYQQVYDAAFFSAVEREGTLTERKRQEEEKA
jgi:hypothetical protein